MGINFSHGDAYWSYSGFHRFRTKLAAEAGIALNCMESFAWEHNTNKPYKIVAIWNESKTDFIGYQQVIKWNTIKDNIKPLMNHSDCDGKLTIPECKKVVPRLRQLVENWDDLDGEKTRALKLADGMEQAIKEKKQFKFL